jgi:hypothetical protein
MAKKMAISTGAEEERVTATAKANGLLKAMAMATATKAAK